MEGPLCPRRRILHLDIDAFLASVVQLLEPALIGRPVVVGTGVVASRSYEAKARGVDTAMPIREARRRCPELIVREGEAATAARFRLRVGEILGRFAPIVEVTSLDDMYADLGGLEWNADLIDLARRIRSCVRRETGLSVAQGIGATKTLARLATTRAKPGGIFWVKPGEERAFLDSLEIDAIPGVGRKTAATLRRYRIERVAELRLVGRELLRESFGKRGEELWCKLRGMPANEDDRRIAVGTAWGEPGGSWGGDGPSEQISRETSLWEATADPAFLRGMLVYLVDRATRTLRASDRLAQRVDVRLTLASGGPEDGHSRGRSPGFLKRGTSLAEPSACSAPISTVACALLDQLFDANRCLVRKVGVRLSRLRDRVPREQALLFVADERDERARRVDAALDTVRDRYGFGAVLAGQASGLLGKLALGREGFRLRTPSLTL